MLKELKKQNKGFASVVEVIVTSVIFIVAAAGILTTISMLRPQGEDSSERLEAAYVAKGIIDDLRGRIDATTWNTAGGGYETGQVYTQVVNGIYTVNYMFQDVPGLGLKRMTMNIWYPDA